MRISDLSGMLNLNRLKNNIDKKTGGADVFKTGDVIEGKVLEAQGKALVLMLNDGKMLRLQDMGNNSYQLGDAVKMELVKEGDVLMGRVIEVPVETMDKEELSDAALKQIGLETTEERKTVAKLLRLNGMPITKENVLALTEAKKYVSRLSDLTKGNMIDASKLPIDKSIKSILIEHLNKSELLYQAPKDGEITTVKELLAAEVSLKAAETLSKEALFTAEKNVVLSSEKTMGMTPLLNDDGSVSKTSANAYLSEKLDKVEYKSLVFNLKNNVENTVKNLVLLDKVILGSDSVTRQLERFSKNMRFVFNKSNISEQSHPALIKLLDSFQEISLRDYDLFKETADKLIESLKEEPSMTSIDRAVTSAQVQTITSSLTYLNDMSQNLVYVQMPVQLNDQTQNMDLYIKKNPKKKQIDPSHCSIFLSLDTDNCYTVKSLLELNHEKATITFKLKDEDMVAYFDEHLEALEIALKEKGYHNVRLNAIEYKKNENYILEDEEKFSEHMIDVKL